VIELVLLFVVAVTGRPPPPSTPPPTDRDKARNLAEGAARHYDLAEYDDAIELLKEAYRLSEAPGLLFNIAQAYRKKGDCDQALLFYQNYLRVRPEARDRTEVEARISQMDRCRTREAPEPSKPIEQKAAASVEPKAPSPPWFAFALGGAGVLAAAGGGALLATVGDQLSTCTPFCDPSHVDDLRLRAAFGYVLLAVGGLSVLAGLLIGILGSSDIGDGS
jgi:tetratricopeptide (TPR) repeat protein